MYTYTYTHKHFKSGPVECMHESCSNGFRKRQKQNGKEKKQEFLRHSKLDKPQPALKNDHFVFVILVV